MVEPTLYFDAMDEDTELAKEYLKQNDLALPPVGNPVRIPRNKRPNNFKSEFKNLAQKLEQNAELFSQLEFHLRKIPKHEVVQSDIRLLVQNFLFWSSNNNFNSVSNDTVIVGNRGVLATLGLVAPILQNFGYVRICAVQSFVAVCHLFCQLCEEVGLSTYLIELTPSDHVDCIGDVVKRQDGSDAHGAGVITQRSDLDSAVHAFLGSTTKYPWSIRRVWVQESIYQQFKNVMAWKCQIKPCNVTVEERIKSLCSQVFYYNQKLFLIDYAGNPIDLNEEMYLPVIVEAYRTTKELLSLLKLYSPWALSIWSSDVAEANEVAFGVNSPLVWVNDYGTFTGPPRASQVFYSNIQKYSFRLVEDSLTEEELKLRNSWRKLSVADRVEALRTALVQFKPGSSFTDELLLCFDNLQERVGFKEYDKFVEVENDRICVGTEEPTGFVCLNNIDYDVDVLANIFIAIVRGNAAVYCAHNRPDLLLLLREFERNKLPVSDRTKASYTSEPTHYFYRTKVVWTNYGTTFAN